MYSFEQFYSDHVEMCYVSLFTFSRNVHKPNRERLANNSEEGVISWRTHLARRYNLSRGRSIVSASLQRNHLQRGALAHGAPRHTFSVSWGHRRKAQARRPRALEADARGDVLPLSRNRRWPPGVEGGALRLQRSGKHPERAICRQSGLLF